MEWPLDEPDTSMHRSLLKRLSLLATLLLAAACASDPVVTEGEARAEYERFAAQTRAGHEYRVRHVLVETKAQADRALQRIRGGEPFEKVAASVSRDPGSGVRGGDLGWSSPAHFVGGFAEAMVALAPRGLSVEPTRTEFGWHVIEVTDMRPAEPPPYSALRERIIDALKARRRSGS